MGSGGSSKFGCRVTKDDFQFKSSQNQNIKERQKKIIPKPRKPEIRSQYYPQHKKLSPERFSLQDNCQFYKYKKTVPRNFFSSWILNGKQPFMYSKVKKRVDEKYWKVKPLSDKAPLIIVDKLVKDPQQACFGRNNIDEREIVQDVNMYPFSCIGVISSNFSKNKQQDQGYGTGTLISPEYVITCAHVIVKDGMPLASGVFVPGMDGLYGKQTYSILNYFVPQQYFQCKTSQQRKQWDIAVIQIQRKQDSKYSGYLGVNSKWAPLKSQNILLYGYPFDKCLERDSDGNSKFQFGSPGNIIQYNEKNIWYSHTTAKGQSGSPLIRKLGQGKFQIIGIHTRADYSKKANCGTRLTPFLAQMISKWIGIQYKTENILDIHRSQQKIQDNQFQGILQTNQNEKISEIDISDNLITNKGVQKLMNMGNSYSQLAVLNLSKNLIGDSGLKLLLSQGFFRHLWKLNLKETGLTSYSKNQLAKIDKSLQALTHLNIRKNKFNQENKKCLQLILKVKMIQFRI